MSLITGIKSNEKIKSIQNKVCISVIYIFLKENVEFKWIEGMGRFGELLKELVKKFKTLVDL